MAWHSRPLSECDGFNNDLQDRLQAFGVVLVLFLACLALLLTAPTDGDFWWNDAPRHALNGAFIMDLVAAHPFHDPVRWAIDYYLMRPALTIMFYPPLFYCVEAIAFAVFGVSHVVAQAAVVLFCGLLAGSVYLLARAVLPRWSAVGAALLAIGTPETAFWGRQIMLDVPAYALIATSACFLLFYLRKGHPRTIYLTALFLVAAIYTKYNAGFIAPALVATFIMTKGRAAFRDRHAIAAAAIACIGLVPAAVMMHQFGASNLQSLSGLEGTIPPNSLECWLFYLKVLPAQLGTMTVILAAGGLALLANRAVVGRDRSIYRLLLAWLLVGYLVFSAISLKENRDTIMVLLPLAIAGPLFLLMIPPRPLGELAGLALGVGTICYSLMFCPVDRVGGYKEIAAYLAEKLPRNGVVAYSGFRDANLIFDLAAIPGRSDITVVRIDKLLLSAPVGERRRGVKQSDLNETGIAELLRGLGATFFVIQPGFWSDLQVMSRFDSVIRGTDYETVRHFGLTGTLSSQDGKAGIEVLRPTYAIATKFRRLDIDMPLAGQRFQQDAQPN
jgi:hypothetical protein